MSTQAIETMVTYFGTRFEVHQRALLAKYGRKMNFAQIERAAAQLAGNDLERTFGYTVQEMMKLAA